MLFDPHLVKTHMNQNIVERRQVSATVEREIAKNIFAVAPRGVAHERCFCECIYHSKQPQQQLDFGGYRFEILGHENKTDGG